MPSTPIPISSVDTIRATATTPPPSLHPGMTSTSPSSAISVSPQTPFFPPPGLAHAHATSPNKVDPSSPPGANSGFFKWAAAAASLGKSPPTDAHTQRGFDIPTQSGVDDHEHENHDSFEFGDFDDLKSRSWNKSRRAVSMSAGPGTTASGITALLSGFGARSPSNPAGPLGGAGSPLKEPMLGMGNPNGVVPTSMPVGGVLAENAAKGQGVLRRLSLGGSSFGRSGLLSPTSAQVPSPPPNAASLNNSGFSFPVDSTATEPPKADPGLQRAATVGGGTSRGRRYSESGGKKRGVSPMGERILRDHGHF